MAQALTLSRPLDGLRNRATQLVTSGRALWHAYPRESIGAGILTLVGAVALGGSLASAPNSVDGANAAPPAPPPLLLRQIAPEQALQLNAEVPLAHGPNPAATPFSFKGSSTARAQALECLASAVYYEAGNQDADGERAVAQVVLNRVRHPAFPASVCGVVYQGSTRQTGCQFTFTCDGSLTRRPDNEGWRRAYGVAETALNGFVYAPVGWATHYHANYVVPYWSSSLAKSAVVGAHIFYRWAGGWGQPAVFSEAYSGREPDAAVLRTAALSVVHTAPVLAQGTAVAELLDKVQGAEVIKLEPSMRGDKRVAIRFNLAARKASEEAPREDYSKKFDASDNLKWSLSSAIVAQDEKPLGTVAAASTIAGGQGAGASQR